MKHTILIFLIAFCWSLMSCEKGHKNPTFPIEKTLAQELMPLQGITNPVIVEIKYPYLVFMNVKMQDSLFQIYDLRTKEQTYAWGRIGDGPEEFKLPWLMHTPFPELVITDRHTFHFYRINEKEEATRTRSREPQYPNYVTEAAFLNDSTFVVDAMYTGPSLHLCNMRDEAPLKSWKYRDPNRLDYITDPNMGHLCANENRIILAYEYRKEIDFMDTEFNLIKKVKFDFPTSDESLLGKGDENSAYTYGYLGERYFYVNYFGTSWKQCRKNGTYGTYIEVYSLDGDPVARYFLEGKMPVYFAVDETTFTLYGTPLDNLPEDNLLVYRLKGLQ